MSIPKKLIDLTPCPFLYNRRLQQLLSLVAALLISCDGNILWFGNGIPSTMRTSASADDADGGQRSFLSSSRSAIVVVISEADADADVVDGDKDDNVDDSWSIT